MSDSTPTESLNTGRVMVRTFGVLGKASLTLIGLAALGTIGGVAIQLLVIGQMHEQITRMPALALAPWAAQFPLYVLSDTAVVVAALVVLGGGRGRPLWSLLAALGVLPVCLVVDLVENLPEPIQILIQNGAPDTAVTQTISLLVAAAWNAALMPALAVAAEEHHGPVATLRRSFALARGHWFRLFSFTLMLQAATSVLPYLIIEVLVVVTGRDAPGWTLEVAKTPFLAFASIAQATLYWELARLKDGVNPREVGSIFD